MSHPSLKHGYDAAHPHAPGVREGLGPPNAPTCPGKKRIYLYILGGQKPFISSASPKRLKLLHCLHQVNHRLGYIYTSNSFYASHFAFGSSLPHTQNDMS